KKFGVHGGIGLISSRLTVEGPLKKDTSSFIVSGRRTYIDVLLNPLVSDTSQFNGSGYYFYDINARVNYILGPKDRLHLSGYYGRDVFSFKDRDNNFDVSSPWGNAMASFGWNHLFSNKLSMNTSVLFTDYQFEFTGGQDDFVFQLYTSIRDWSLKFDFDYLPNNRHHIRFGIGNTYHTFTPGNVTARTDEVNFNTGELISQYAQEGGVYVQDEFTVTDQLTVNAGLRFSLFGHFGPFKRFIRDETNTERIVDTTEYGRAEKVALYTGWEPRLAVRYRLNSRASIKGGITHNYQYVHLASYSPLSLPMDIWMPSSDVVQPQVGTQYALGYFRNFKEDTYETSVEVYYKTMNNLVEFQEGALPSDNVAENPDNNLTFGDGYSYGAEFFVKKRLGKLTGWIGYTWSKTEREFDEINGGEIFPARYDRRHDLSTVATYKLNDRWTVAGTFVYGTGQAITLPVARYVVEGEIVNEYGPRNGFRLGAYHRLDFSATLHGKKRKRFESSWTFAVYNVYNRANPYFIYFDNEGNLEDGTLEITAKQVSLFPILPSVTWNFKF
ncbi:MAG: TonB-dependent receptor, partial [Bacteroidota bacterium]